MKSKLAAVLMLACLAWGSVPQAQDTRQVYLSPIDGSGTEADPWHSRCLGIQGSGNIDLRPYEIDAFLCASNDLPADMTGVEQIGASLRSSIGARKGGLDAKFKKTLVSTNVEDLIIEVISPKLRAGKDGKLKIYLGGPVPVYQQTAWVPFRDNGLVADLGNAAMGLIEPTRAWAAAIADDWNCSNGASLTCDLTWTEFQGTEWGISSNQAVYSGSGQEEARADTTLDGANHWAQATLVAVSSDASGTMRCGPLARKDNTSTRDFYTFAALHTSGAFSSYSLDKRVAGALTALSSNATDPVANEVVRVYVDGTSVSGYVDGVLRVAPVTDASITSNTYTGISASWNGTGTMGCTLDNFSAGDISVTRIRGGPLWFP